VDRRLIGILALAACSYRAELRVTPLAIEQAAASLRAGQPVAVMTEDNKPVTVQPAQIVEVVTTDHSFPIAVADVIRECTAHEPDPNRLCELHDVRWIVVGHERVRRSHTWSPAGVAIAGATTAAIGGLGACAAECGKPYNYVSGALVVGAAIGFMLLLVDSTLH